MKTTILAALAAFALSIVAAASACELTLAAPAEPAPAETTTTTTNPPAAAAPAESAPAETTTTAATPATAAPATPAEAAPATLDERIDKALADALATETQEAFALVMVSQLGLTVEIDETTTGRAAIIIGDDPKILTALYERASIQLGNFRHVTAFYERGTKTIKAMAIAF